MNLETKHQALLTDDEVKILEGYRLIREQGSGSMIFQMEKGQVIKWDVHPNLGGATVFNAVLGKIRS